MLNIPLSSPHVHSQFCDGQSTAEEMVQSAIRQGFVSLGISSHGVQDFELDYAIKPDEEDLYVAEIRRLQHKYRDQLRIWLGTERDRLSICDRQKYEYLIGSVHYFPDGDGYYCVDGDPVQLQDAIARRYGGDGALMAVDYYHSLGLYIEQFRPDIIGHFDLVMKHNRQGQLFDPADKRVLTAIEEALQRAIKGCSLMEINTGALARSSGGAIYPSLAILERWRMLGGEVILSSDCHRADQISHGYEEGLQRMLKAGYREMVILGRSDQLFERCKL